MANYIVTDAELTNTADALREKLGSSGGIEWENDTGFAGAIEAIPSGKTIEIVAAVGVGAAPANGSATLTEVISTPLAGLSASGQINS